VGVMGPKLYLLENVQAEVGKGRPFQATDLNFPDIDNTQLLYPIRGSYDWYVCHINEVGFPAGKAPATRPRSVTGVARWSTASLFREVHRPNRFLPRNSPGAHGHALPHWSGPL
jgi:hypothetical protein